MPRFVVGVLSFVALLCSPYPLQAEWTLLDGARVHPDYHGPVPKKSDVIFSTRFKRDNAADVARAYGATRIEWVYSTDPKFVRSLQSVAPWFGGAVSSTIPLPKDEGIAKDLEGRPIVAPWMKSWGAKWITTTDLHARQALKDVAQLYLELGANSVQVDDPLLQFTAASWGGDFSESSLSGFRTFLSHYADQAELQRAGIAELSEFDYREFLARQFNIRTTKEYLDRYRTLSTTPLWLAYLKDSVISHFTDFRAFLNAKKGSAVALSMNLLLSGPDKSKPQFDLLPFVDYAMVETKINDLDIVSLQAATYRALGIGYVPSIQPLSKLANRTAIAALYAMGGQPLVPWDVYINNGPDKQPTRFFGAPEDYADLYRFVADNSVYFDNYEELAVVGIIVPVDRYQIRQTMELVRRLTKERVPYAIIPIGAAKPIDRKRASHFRLLLTVNSIAQFSPAELLDMRSLPVKAMHADDVSNEMLASYSPFGRMQYGRTLLIARGTKDSAGRIIIHVLRPDESEDGTLEKSCDHVVGFSPGRDITDSISSVTWRSLSGLRNLSFNRSSNGVSVEVPDCDEWGLLEFSRN